MIKLKPIINNFLLTTKIQNIYIHKASYEVISKIIEIRQNSIFPFLTKFKEQFQQVISDDYVFVRLSVVNNLDITLANICI